jgi:hypothetical protein
MGNVAKGSLNSRAFALEWPFNSGAPGLGLPDPLFVLVVFVDMDVLQHADGVLRQNHN